MAEELPPMEESFQDKKARIIEQERAKVGKERILEINQQLKAISPQMARFISTQNYEMVRQFKEKAEQLQKEKDALIPIALKEEEQKQNFCISLKAAILDEEKASKEYKEMAENLPITQKPQQFEISVPRTKRYVVQKDLGRHKIGSILNLPTNVDTWHLIKAGQIKEIPSEQPEGKGQEKEVLKKISEDEAKHKLHLEQIAKDLGCKNG